MRWMCNIINIYREGGVYQDLCWWWLLICSYHTGAQMHLYCEFIPKLQLSKELVVCVFADFLLCTHLGQSMLFGEFDLPALLPACFTTRLLLRRSPYVWLNQCHFCMHGDPDALAPAASPHGRAGSSYDMATPREKDPIMASQVSLNSRRRRAPSARVVNWKSNRSERKKTDNRDK